MGTRSVTLFLKEGKEFARIYRQMDGYPSGHGMDLAKACNVMLVNGFGMDMKAGTHANGMGCLAAQVVSSLKDGIGGIYLETPGGDFGWSDYVYVVSGKEGENPTIECYGYGAWGKKKNYPFPKAPIWKGTAAEFLATGGNVEPADEDAA